MQICLDNLLHYCLYVCALVIKIYFAQKLFSAICEAFSLDQIKVSFVFILLDRNYGFPMFVLHLGL